MVRSQNRQRIPICVLWCALGSIGLLVAPARADLPEDSILKAARVEANEAGLRALLNSVGAKSSHSTAEIDEWVTRLASENFPEREKATAKLLALPILPAKELQAALQGPDTEARIRARQIIARFERRPPISAQLFAACLIIRDRAIPSLNADLLRVLPKCDGPALSLLATQALRATVRKTDRLVLKSSLSSDDVRVRVAALACLDALATNQAAVDDVKNRVPNAQSLQTEIARARDMSKRPSVTWEDYMDAFLVHGRADGQTTIFVKGLPASVAEHFEPTTRGAGTSDAVANRNATAPWLYPTPGRNESPRPFVENGTKHYPVWGTWRQNWSQWVTLDENGVALQAEVRRGAHLETRVDLLRVPSARRQPVEK